MSVILNTTFSSGLNVWDSNDGGKLSENAGLDGATGLSCSSGTLSEQGYLSKIVDASGGGVTVRASAKYSVYGSGFGSVTVFRFWSVSEDENSMAYLTITDTGKVEVILPNGAPSQQSLDGVCTLDGESHDISWTFQPAWSGGAGTYLNVAVNGTSVIAAGLPNPGFPDTIYKFDLGHFNSISTVTRCAQLILVLEPDGTALSSDSTTPVTTETCGEQYSTPTVEDMFILCNTIPKTIVVSGSGFAEGQTVTLEKNGQSVPFEIVTVAPTAITLQFSPDYGFSNGEYCVQVYPEVLEP